MAPKKYFFAVFIFSGLLTDACSQKNFNKAPPTVFVGSTPCDSTIKKMLQIPGSTTYDFIKWELALTDDGKDSAFVMNIAYGVSQPNTLGFINGGEKRSYKGAYSVSPKNNGAPGGIILQLKTENSLAGLSLVKLNDNLLHLLTPSGSLMVGNGGWSYTLNRKNQTPTTTPLPVFAALPTIPNNALSQIIFDGRSPCQEFAAEHQMKVSTSCFKLKWRLILNRDPVNHQPTTYSMRKIVDNEPKEVSGKWTVIKGIEGNPAAIIYQLDPDKPAESVSFLVGDENVLFFLNQEYELYVGNSDFSFTLNKKQ